MDVVGGMGVIGGISLGSLTRRLEEKVLLVYSDRERILEAGLGSEENAFAIVSTMLGRRIDAVGAFCWDRSSPTVCCVPRMFEFLNVPDLVVDGT